MTTNKPSAPKLPPQIKRQVFKIQTSIMPPGRIMIYNEDRSILKESQDKQFFDQIVRKYKLFNAGGRIFVKGYLNGLGKLVLEQKTKDQDW